MVKVAPIVMSTKLRERLGLSRSQWARALGVNERTVARWEDEGNDPGGVALDVMRAILHALNDGADVELIKGRVGMGIHAMIYAHLVALK